MRPPRPDRSSLAVVARKVSPGRRCRLARHRRQLAGIDESMPHHGVDTRRRPRPSMSGRDASAIRLAALSRSMDRSTFPSISANRARRAKRFRSSSRCGICRAAADRLAGPPCSRPVPEQDVGEEALEPRDPGCKAARSGNLQAASGKRCWVSRDWASLVSAARLERGKIWIDARAARSVEPHPVLDVSRSRGCLAQSRQPRPDCGGRSPLGGPFSSPGVPRTPPSVELVADHTGDGRVVDRRRRLGRLPRRGPPSALAGGPRAATIRPSRPPAADAGQTRTA